MTIASGAQREAESRCSIDRVVPCKADRMGCTVKQTGERGGNVKGRQGAFPELGRKAKRRDR